MKLETGKLKESSAQSFLALKAVKVVHIHWVLLKIVDTSQLIAAVITS